MPIAREGWREIGLATLILGALSGLAAWLFWPVAIPAVGVWFAVLWFFRDPRRHREFDGGELCAPADGTVMEVTELDTHELIARPATRIGIFMSLLNVHINRAPCSGRVRSVTHRLGDFLDARHGQSGERNESNTLVIEPDEPLPGPVVVRQVAGMIARRIVCHVGEASHLAIGERFGMIKFGSRVELIVPRTKDTEIPVKVGDKVHAGLTVVARQPVAREPVAAGQEPLTGHTSRFECAAHGGA
jgi:phosphatidylserine decarboxylase